MKLRVIPCFLGFIFFAWWPMPGAGSQAAARPLAVSPAASANRKSAPRTVVDYYLLLPRDRYFEWDTEEDLRRIIRPSSRGVTDIPHGYLETMGDGAQARTTVRLFKHSDGTHLVAVSANRASDGVWEPWIHFYRYREGRLVDVTADTQPMPVAPPLGFTLPREGIAIHVVEKPSRQYHCGRKPFVVEVPGKVRHKWFWTGERFEVRPGTAGPPPGRARRGAEPRYPGS